MLFLFPIAVVIISGLSFFLTSVAHSMPYVHLLTPTVSIVVNLLPYVIMSLLFIGSTFSCQTLMCESTTA